MVKGDTTRIVVGLRNPEEYEHEHSTGALSIPSYKDSNTSASGNVDRIVSSLRFLEESNPAKDIFVYCYSILC